MQVTITTPYRSTTVELTELTPSERNALAGLFGLKELKNKAFALLRDTPSFKKILPYEVWAQCPKKARGPGEMTISVTPLEMSPAQQETLDAMLKHLPKGATYRAKRHRASVWCKKCNCPHEIVRDSVLITAPVDGITFSKRFAL